ncbi:ATP-binding protein [Glutamicibacter protophormiae]|uniref:ATP-binding protein n=1 Tax=Glutamicibacter protophormiae TaxID=37930 RepID=UPI001EF5CF03|nr:ATP-binding protein [Glutamicibacter protophormiae]
MLPNTSVKHTGAGKTYLVCAIGIAACHTEYSVAYTRMDDLARKLLIARNDGVGHQDLLLKLCDVDLLIIDDFLTVASIRMLPVTCSRFLLNVRIGCLRLSRVRLIRRIGCRPCPIRIAGDSIVNRLATNTRWIVLGNTDMRKLKHDEARAATDYWE